MAWRAWGLLVLTCAAVGGGRALAQPSLIVRLDADADASLHQTLATGTAKAGPWAHLLAGSTHRASVFRAFGPGKASAALASAYVVSYSDSAGWRSARAAWASTPGVAYVHPNHRYRLAPASGGPDPLADSLGHLDVVEIADAWAVTRGAATVRVGFIDTGVWFEHPDLRGQFWTNPGEDLDGDGRVDAEDFNGIDDDGNGWVDDLRGFDFVDHGPVGHPGDVSGRDPDASEENPPFPAAGRGHGTLVAGVLAAAGDNGVGIAGVAPGVRLVPLRAFTAEGVAEDDDLAAAIAYAADQGLDVVNLSFGDAYLSPLLQDAIAYAHARGTIVVASGGNVGGDAPHYPSDFDGVIAVAWLTADGTAAATRATHGAGIDLGAPGTGIFSTVLPPPEMVSHGAAPADALYGRRSGSSMAAPQVSAAAALLRSVDPSLSPSAIRGILARSAKDVGAAGWDHRTGAGLLDVAAAVRQALPGRIEIHTPAQDDGIQGGDVVIEGSVTDPFFRSYAVEVAPGHADPEGEWIPIGGPVATQTWQDTLAVWATDALAEGPYTLRLRVALTTGQSIEVRRRVYLDRSAPVVTPIAWGIGFADGRYGVVAHVATDDLTDASLKVESGAGLDVVPSDRRARRHGLAWTPRVWGAQTVNARLSVTNVAGASTTIDTTLVLPPHAPDAGLLKRVPLDVPPGYLLPLTTDFDGDGLQELVLNLYGPEGWIGDTLAIYEWAGTGVDRAFALEANVLPRDVGDADGDGLAELLTQVQAATLLLEQATPAGYPTAEAFLDTVGLADPAAPGAVYGAQLTDLDGDGRGEILAHNSRAWRVLEYDGRSFQEAAVLANDTPDGSTQGDGNRFEQPHALAGDLDADGRPDVVVADSDGDVMVFEPGHPLAGRHMPVWSYATEEYSRGVRLAAGDFDGDGRQGFALFTETWDGLRSDGDYEPAFGTLRVWEAEGDDAYRLQGSWTFAGRSGRHGALAALDVDGDGADELIVAHAPDLYVLSAPDADPPVLGYHSGPATTGASVRSARIAVGDLDGDRSPDLILAEAASLARYVPHPVGPTVQVPAWETAEPIPGGVTLRWHAPGLDSTSVYHSGASGPLELIHTTAASGWQYATADPGPHAFVLVGWRGGIRSGLSPSRSVEVRPPTVLTDATFVSPSAVQLHFSAPVEAASARVAFVTGEGLPLRQVVLSANGRAVTVGVPDDEATATITWKGLRDRYGQVVAPVVVPIDRPRPSTPLVLASWSFEPAQHPRRVLLSFDAPVEPSTAIDRARYTVRPSGAVGAVHLDETRPNVIDVEIVGRRIGPTGQEAALVVDGIRGLQGGVMPEPVAISLVRPAVTLAEAFVYPNPCRAAQHGERLTVAGLTPEATVHVLSADGQLLRRLEERGGDGGLVWDLRDASGREVPSGVYLVRIEAPGQPSVLRKAAVIR